MVAIMLLAFALVGIVPLFLAGFSQASDIRTRSIATNVARERIELIRQLDYREITQDETEGTTLDDRFGNDTDASKTRGIPFAIQYIVAEGTGEGELKEVTVIVSWAGPPSGQTSITTMIHQQFVGPTGGKLVVEDPEGPDPLGTPFRLIGEGSDILYYLAESDWGLLFEDVTHPSTTLRAEVYARFTFYGEDGVRYQLGDPADEYALYASEYLDWTLDADGNLSKVWYEYDLADFQTLDADSGTYVCGLPDGYWELQAVAYNQYSQPGNVWRLRVRMDNYEPAAPDPFVAYADESNDQITLTWAGGPELDRDHYELERRVWNPGTWDPVLLTWSGGSWSAWVSLDDDIDPKAVNYVDLGNILSSLHPFGPSNLDPYPPNYYQYRLHACDFAADPPPFRNYAYCPGRDPDYPDAGPLSLRIPADTATTTTTIPTDTTVTSVIVSTTTTLSSYSVSVQNDSSDAYSIRIQDEDKDVIYTGTVKKGKTITVKNLDPGDYQVQATADDVLTASFSLPELAGEVVMVIDDI